jgi:carbon-monoxide dehydrogenase small subunit
MTLADFVREKCGLTGTHLGCEHGAYGVPRPAVRFCTPGFVMSITALLRDNPHPTEHQIRDGPSGNFCRCTGYQGIVNAVHRAAEIMPGAATVG